MKNIIRIFVVTGFCCSVFGLQANSGKIDTADLPIIKTGMVSPFKVCLQPQDSASKTSEAWSVDQGYVTADQAKTLATTPVCFDQNLTIADFNQLTDFEKDLFAAAGIWQSYMKISTPIEIDVHADNSEKRFGANQLSGATIPHVITVGDKKMKFKEVQPMALTLAKNPPTPSIGPSNPVPAIAVYLNQTFGNQYYCFDSTPTVAGDSKCSINPNEFDVTSVLLHELGHGFGIGSYRSMDSTHPDVYGTFQGGWIGTFDYHTNVTSGLNAERTYDFAQPYQSYFADNQHFLLFTGPHTQDYLESVGYNTPPEKSGVQTARGVPICNFSSEDSTSSQNFSHFGINDSNDPAENVVNNDLMGLWINWRHQNSDTTLGQRLNISTLDLKVLEDMGYPLQTDVARQDQRDIFEHVDPAR